jgi:hypothetical protein
MALHQVDGQAVRQGDGDERGQAEFSGAGARRKRGKVAANVAFNAAAARAAGRGRDAGTGVEKNRFM